MHDRHAAERERERLRITEQAASWYLDLHDEEAGDLREPFLAWLKHSPQHVAEYLAMAQLHDELHDAASMETLDAHTLAALALRDSPVVVLHPETPFAAANHVMPTTARKREARRTRRIALGAAASIVGLGLLLWGSLHSDMHRVAAVDYASDAQGRAVELSDGTLIQLRQHSRIAVRYDAHQREIELLQGGAVFDVGKDPTRPLRVTLGSDSLRDIGTVFSVERDANGEQIAVLSGQVNLLGAAPSWRQWWGRLSGDGANDARPTLAQLHRGDQAVVDARGGLQQRSHYDDSAPSTAWLPRDIRFQNITVAEVARRFNAYTTRPLLVEDPNVASIRISGVFHGNDPDAFVAYLATLPGVAVARSADAVHIGERMTPSASPLHAR